ncbi:MAG: hypothetical protein B7Z55_04655 [Planctomycetales bacterium 12-60-4]|nr:MAG: hypothetical protein B7Z55_04655 [Planctomycetales bacterium 12-60-4]
MRGMKTVLRGYFLVVLTFGLIAETRGQSSGPAPSAAQRRQQALEFHIASQQRAGVLVPMYVYPADIHANPEFNRLIALKRRYETVPIWVIVNPGSGPGTVVDPNYTKAIDRLQGAGCVVLGYVSTSYAQRPMSTVITEIDRWLSLYPRTQGIFFDEMIYEDTPAGAEYQSRLNQYAASRGCWPTVANPGAETPGRYFAAKAADVIVVHEGDHWPTEDRLHGDYFGGYADYPPWTRSVLVHSSTKLDLAALDMARKYARWFYVTERPYRANDPTAANPWDTLSQHLDLLCSELAKHP